MLKCPSCGYVLHQDSVDVINSVLATSKYKPDTRVNNYDIWFTGYKARQADTALRGQVVAFPVGGSEDIFVCEAGYNNVFKDKPGEDWPYFDSLLNADNLSLRKAKEYKDAAIKAMVKFIGNLSA